MLLAALLKAYRTQHGVSVRKLAKVIGISHSSLFKFENGKALESDQLIKVLRWMFGDNA